jgi:DNA-binding winged helix-turn-helix (wHTH) protein
MAQWWGRIVVGNGGEGNGTYRLLRFGVFELNLDLDEIRKNETRQKLPPQPFRLLELLASRSGQVVTHDEIRQHLWGSDTFIDFEQGVRKCIKQIRTVLGDNPDNPLFVEAIPRRGYRFLAPVRTKIVPAPPPQVKEASSGLLVNIAEQVRERAGAGSPHEPSSLQSAPKAINEVTEQRTPSYPRSIVPSGRTRFTWVVPIVLLLAIVLYGILSSALR